PGPAPLEAASMADPARILAYAAGADLVGLKYRHPFYDRVSPVVPGEHVTLEQGTGLVHGLDVYDPVRDDGRYDDTVGPALAGKKVQTEANPLVIELLVEKGALLNDQGDSVTQGHPHCRRCHHPVIFRAGG